MAGYTIDADTDKNRLYVTLEGMLDEDDFGNFLDEVDEAMARLEPGFTTVNDISEYRPVSEAATEVMEEAKRRSTDRGNRATVRVTGESAIGEMQWERHGTDEQGYQVAKAETVAEADRMLDELQGV